MRSSRGWGLGLAGLLAALVGCGPEGPARARFEDAPCAFEVPESRRVRCGWLHVPENRADPASRSIRLPVAILATTGLPLPDPVVLLGGGGPGGAVGLGRDDAAQHFEMHYWIQYSEVDLRFGRDLILLEQRGAGRSDPELDCPEDAALVAHDLGATWSLPELVEGSRVEARRCRRSLVESGVDLRGYTTAASAADAEDLRRALGIPRWNLYGTSYGTQIALALLRDHPESVRSAVLDSPMPLDVAALEELPAATERAFAALFASCAAAPACRESYPDLERRFDAGLQALSAAPRRVSVANPAGGEIAVEINAQRWIRCLLLGMYSADRWQSLPAEIAAVADARAGQLERCAADLVDESADPLDSFSSGLFYAIECADEVPWSDAARARAARERFPRFARYHDEIDASMRASCEAWALPAAPAREQAPVVSDVPVLLLAGGWDPVTPPSWSRRAAATLSRGYVFEFAETPHGVLWQEPCAERVAGAFLDAPDERPAPRCFDRERTPRLAQVVRSADRPR